MEEDYKPAVQSQRWVNLKIHNVIKKEVTRLLDADGFSSYFQIPINPPDQEKTTFTCPYGTFAYRRMTFDLCHVPGTFQRCMLMIFHDMIEKTIEVFMDEFLVFGDSFSSCLSHLDTVFQRCEDTNLVLNWEKCHFMVKEGIFLDHKIYKNGLEVNRFKVDVIAKLPYPTTVKGVRSFLGQAGFYRRFIHDFSKIARTMTHLLEKETPFVFSKDCIDAFETLKKKLTEAPILVVLDWNLPFELMYFMGPFPSSRGNRYILVVVDHSSKWVKAKALPTNDAHVVVKFIKSLFARFITPRAIINDRGTHLCNDKFAKVMSKDGVTHRLSTTYHPQTSGQVQVLNHGLKRILERTVGENHASWSKKLDDTLWAFRTTYKIPIGCTPYKLVYGKSLVTGPGIVKVEVPYAFAVVRDSRSISLSEKRVLLDAKTLFEAIQARFCGNDATKKTQRTLLKQMYENFNAPSTESLDSIYNMLQKIVSQLAILGENISQEDLNIKFLRSLPSE
nr:reverse transcriptase domain-containing protein [Tanacetum cinerariifolium]